jgi:hypothetical protein
LEGYDPFNGLVTLQNLVVTVHRKDIQETFKTQKAARRFFDQAVAETQF